MSIRSSAELVEVRQRHSSFEAALVVDHGHTGNADLFDLTSSNQNWGAALEYKARRGHGLVNSHVGQKGHPDQQPLGGGVRPDSAAGCGRWCRRCAGR